MRPEDESKVIKFFNSKEPAFVSACERVKLPPTRRQASKWLSGKGKAFKEEK